MAIMAAHRARKYGYIYPLSSLYPWISEGTSPARNRRLLFSMLLRALHPATGVIERFA